MPPKRDVRYAANTMDYRKTIVPREIQKDWRPRDPRVTLPRARQVVAFKLVELSENLVRLRTSEAGWRICPASLAARVPGKLTLTV